MTGWIFSTGGNFFCRGWVNTSISVRLPLTAGELCTWCRTWRAWALLSFHLARVSKICRLRPKLTYAQIGAMIRRMRTFNYATLKDHQWDSEILGLVAQIHEFKGRHELYLKQKPAALDKLIEIAKNHSKE